MKYFNLTKQFPLILGAVALFSACKKVENFEPMGDSGQTVVRLIDPVNANNHTGKATINLNLLSTPQNVPIIRILRDVSNASELNRQMTVIIKDDPAAVTAYNAAHATHYVPLPAGSYSIDPANPLVGGNYTVTLKPGEFTKEIKYTIPNAAGLDLNLSYAFGFAITSVDASGKISAEASSMVVEVGVKNNYDGVYSVVSGFVQRYTGPGSTNPICCDGLTGAVGPANADIELVTTGANTNTLSNAISAVGITWANNTGVGGIGGLRLAVDPVTYLVTMSATESPAGLTLTNWAGHTNKYDPATKTFTLAFRWNPSGATREYEVILKYKGAR